MKKIVVLFGSFNPLTNAHINVLKTAKAAVDADLGLFVATNGDYLRSKSVLKKHDCFYLTEDERKETIVKACEKENGLAFWGFELGGAFPKRYKTLCTIKKEYPAAEIYEVEGADIVKSLTKFKDAEEYVGNTNFIIFERDDIDVKAQIDREPLLKRHENHFTILPSVDGFSEVSSTEIRRRFYAGESYGNLLPQSSVDLLNSHTPADFELSFADKMKFTIKFGGRFGENKARTEVYKENLRIFLDWKNTKNSGTIFGDYQQFLNNTKVYSKEYNVSGSGTVFETTDTGCANIDCVDLAEELISRGYNPAILNLASAHRPGGGYDKGAGAQEESLCRSSNLSLSLYQFGNPKKMKCIRECEVPLKEIGYPLDLNFGGIYTPDVTFFRHGKSQYYACRENPFKCAVITVAALSFSDNHQYSDEAEHCFKAEDGGFTPEGNEIMLNKIRTIFRMEVEHGHDSLILGAFGCGVYHLPPAEVVKQFRTVMEEPEFKNKFKLVTFAILEGKRGPTGSDGKFSAFYHEFGTLCIE